MEQQFTEICCFLHTVERRLSGSVGTGVCTDNPSHVHYIYMLCTKPAIVQFADCTTIFVQFGIGTSAFVPNPK